jgi:hypothetical protein
MTSKDPLYSLIDHLSEMRLLSERPAQSEKQQLLAGAFVPLTNRRGGDHAPS